MKTLNSKAPGVDIIADGHALRWTKQIALRGSARVYDKDGVCGEQRLVIGCDLKRFRVNATRLFPGAKIKTTAESSHEYAPWKTKVIEYLSKHSLSSVITTKELQVDLRKPWRSVSSNVMTPEFERDLASLGWTYVAGLGRSGSRFVRTTTNPEELLSAYLSG